MENFQEDLTTLGTGISAAFQPALELEEPEIKPVEKEGSGPSIKPSEGTEAEPVETGVTRQLEEVDSAMENLKLVPYHQGSVSTNIDFSKNYNDLVTSPDLDDTIEEDLEEEASIDPQGFSSPDEFISYLSPYAKEISKESGIPYEVIMAQAAHETGWGKHIGGDSKNLYGIKADSRWSGDVTKFGTHEYVDGKKVNMEEPFRKYGSYKESMADYAKFLHSNPRYKGALASSSDPIKFAQELQKAGYATDPKYADKLISIMNRFK